MRSLPFVALCLLLAGCSASEPAVALTPETPTIVRGNTEFAIDLYQRLAKTSGNLVISPYSISSALAMTYEGARTETAAEMAEVLRVPNDRRVVSSTTGALNKKLSRKSDGLVLRVANSLWGRSGNFLPEFLEVTKRDYGGGFHEVDFRRRESFEKINDWTSRATEGKIPRIFTEADFDPSTQLVLVNAIYLKGSWLTPFQKDLTRVMRFHVAADKEVFAPMMSRDGRFRYANNGDCRVLELPYRGDTISMALLLPEKSSLAELEAKLSEQNLSTWLKGVKETKIDGAAVAVPKFKLGSERFLNETLKSMKMERAFDGKADFSGMTGQAGLKITQVAHKALIEVDESGTTAAAATQVSTAVSGWVNPPRFVADRPFLFLIRDRETGTILFLGRVVDPTKES